MASISWGTGGGGDTVRKRQSLRWRLTMVAIIVVGAAVGYWCGGAEPQALLAHFWGGQ